MSNVKTAVILAAGMGTRLRDILEDIPKGLLRVEGRELIKESLKRIKKGGIEKIIIVTGFNKEKYEAALQLEYPDIIYTQNLEFASTGSMHSLLMVKDLVDTDFLLLESDLLYEDRCITSLVESDFETAILASGKTGSGDEVYIYGENELIQKINKNKHPELPLIGELVGISKISLDFYKKLCHYYEQHLEQLRYAHYEECISDLSDEHRVYCLKIEDIVWTEIDDPSHYQRALKEIYPKIYGKPASKQSFEN